MGKKQRLSPLEWEIMEKIWNDQKPVSVREVLSQAYPKGEKAYTTVQTVMNNLVAKGFLQKEKIGLVNFYQPRQKKNDLMKQETSRFVEKVFGGSFQALANYIISSKKLSEAELTDLKKLIERSEEGRNGE